MDSNKTVTGNFTGVEYVSQWGSSGSGDNQFGAPEYITLDSSGNVYVSETSNERVSKYTSDGTLLGWWGKDDLGGTGWHAPGTGTTGKVGSGVGEFGNPYGIVVDASGNIYLTEGAYHRIMKFKKVGR